MVNMFDNNKIIALLDYVKPNKLLIFGAVICSAINKVCDIFPEILLAVAVDVVVRQQNSVVAKMLEVSDPAHQLYLVAATTAVLWLFESLFEYLYFMIWHQVAQQIQHDVRLATYKKIQSLDLVYFENKTIGGLLTILQDDVAQLEEFLSKGPNEVIQLVVNIAVIGSLFMFISPMLFALTVVPIPFVIAIAYYFQYTLSILYKDMRKVTSGMASHLVYRLQGLITIKSYCTQSYEFTKLAEESARYKNTFNAVNSVTAFYIPLVRIVMMIGFFVTMIVGGLQVLNGKIAMYWYAELIFLIQRFLWPFASLTQISDMYRKSQASATRILTVLQTQPTIIDGPNAVEIRNCPGTIQFDKVDFVYDGSDMIFHNLSFTIPQRTTAAFVGSTGSGKSTLAKLLLRFYDVESGVINVAGYNIKDIKIDNLRASIGLVSQEVYIIDGTIAQNIAYGTFQASRESIQKAAQMAQIHDFIIQLPDGYDTRLEEYGKKLSGGQRQRISIARALLKDSCILIFDEATSALDNETEAEISKSMDKLRQTHTVIIIAHRLSTVKNADIIFVMDHGKIAESGTHEQLLLKNGIYAQLWNMQLN